MMRRLVKTLSLICLLGIAPQVFASKAPVLGYVNFPPATFQNKDQQADGYVIHFGHQKFEDNNIAVDYRLVPPARLFSEIEQGLIHAWYGIVVPKIKPLMRFSSKPVWNITLNLYRLASSPAVDINELPTWESIILIHGWSYGKLRAQLEQTNTVLNAPNNSAAMEMLKLKRAKYLLSYAEAMDSLASTPKNLMSDNIQVLDIYFQIRKDFPGSEKIVRIFD